MSGALVSVIAAVCLGKKGKRRAIYALSCLAAGFLVSLPLSSSLGRRTVTGFPVPAVTRIACVSMSDSRRTSKGGYVDGCRLKGVWNREGMWSSGEGIITVFTDGEKRLCAGTAVEYSGEFVMTETGDLLFFADSGGFRVITEPRGIYALRASILGSATGCFDRLEEPASGLLTALFLGIRDNLEEQETFRRAGCSHLLALSGMHVGIITGCIGLLLFPLFGKRVSLVLLYGIILVYLFLTGFGPSLNRSAVMFFLLTVPSFFSRKPAPVQVLFLSFTILALFTPRSLETLSFQLSFLALGGILVIGKVVAAACTALPGWLRFPLSASIGAQAATAPLVAALFGVLYPVGIAASIVMTPIVTLVMALGMVFLGVSALGIAPASEAASRGIELLTLLLYRTAGFFSSFPAIHVPEGAWPRCAGGSAIIILFFLGYALIRKRRLFGYRANKLRFTQGPGGFP